MGGLLTELAQAISERDLAHVQLQKERSRAEELEKQVCLCVCRGVRVLCSEAGLGLCMLLKHEAVVMGGQ